MAKIKIPCVVCSGTKQWGGGVCRGCDGKGHLPRRKAIIQLARHTHESEGSVEIDDNAVLSEVPLSEDGDNGCYVRAWVWVDFAGVPGLDKAPG